MIKIGWRQRPIARVQLELLRIRATRTQLTEKTEPNYNNTQELRRIAAFDRYERYCFTKRRRALNKIRCCEDDAHQEIAREGPE